ncbi:hypothetical protein [Aureispira sp. CCB-QB1]|uniref:hypothetical protein n=1 Tax=Aureispira sp. CCB-QB1 TaxID=1313421 RepID=UPI000696CDC0|nr:hypothetical protein [Aureispira sp. CCB-QB1]
MSKYYRIKASKVEGNLILLNIVKISSDAKGITDHGGLEQWALAFMIELNEELLEDTKGFDIHMDKHPYKEKYQNLYGMKMGKKYYVADSDANADTYEGQKVVNRFNFGGKNLLITRPEYKQFCLDAKDYFEVKSLEQNGDHYTMLFEAKDLNMIYHLREGMEWESSAYNMWDMLALI